MSRVLCSLAEDDGRDANRGRCMELHLMSREIHDAAALHQLPPVKAVCIHSGRTLIRFITQHNSSFV